MTDEYIEVPVTRRARVTLVGRLTHDHRHGDLAPYMPAVIANESGIVDLEDGIYVLRPYEGAPFRRGFVLVVASQTNASEVPARAWGDLVYRVEPP